MNQLDIKSKFEKYPAYKDSGVEWIDEIPKHWEMKRLKYLLNELNIRSETGNEELLSLSKYNGVIPKSSLGERAGGAESLVGYKVVKENHLVINKMQAVNGLIAVSKLTGITSPDYSVYFVKAESKLNVNFLCHLILQPQYLAEFKRRVTGVMEGFIRLYTDDLYNVFISLPPIQEQTAIATFLDKKSAKIDHVVAQKEKMIALLKERKQIIIQDLVTGKKVWNDALNSWTEPDEVKDSGVEWIGEIPAHWVVRRFKLLCNISTGSKNTEDKKENGEFPFFVRSQNVERIDTYTFEGEAILTAGDGAGVGKVFHYVNERFDFHQRVYKFSNFKSINGKYLFFYLQSNFYNVALNGEAKSTVDSLRLRLIQDFLVSFPSLKEQTSIVNYIESQSAKIDKAIALQEQQIEKLKELKSTLINSAVTGKIKV